MFTKALKYFFFTRILCSRRMSASRSWRRPCVRAYRSRPREKWCWHKRNLLVQTLRNRWENTKHSWDEGSLICTFFLSHLCLSFFLTLHIVHLPYFFLHLDQIYLIPCTLSFESKEKSFIIVKYFYMYISFYSTYVLLFYSFLLFNLYLSFVLLKISIQRDVWQHYQSISR